MSIVSRDDSSFAEIFKCSSVSSLLHIEKLLLIPGIEVNRLNEGVDHTILAMLSCAVKTEMDSEVYGGPFRVLLFTI